jgi:uncharacterized protein (TIGR02145 family)
MVKKIFSISIVFFLVSCGNKRGEQQGKSDISEKSGVTADTVQQSATVTDIEGNVYNTLKIGRQTWMKENLRTTKFNDGTPIQLIDDGPSWAKTVKPAYCWYNNEPESYKELYGALYNGFAASDDKLCPARWHVPSDAEWNILSGLLGGDNAAGARLKEAGFDYWVSPNLGADNSTGFSALPGGLRYYDGVFHDFGFSSYFWTSEESSPGRLWFRYADYEYTDLFRFNNSANIGFSIRCVRDY